LYYFWAVCSCFVLVNHALLFKGSPSLSLDIANTILKEQGSMRQPFFDREILRETPLIFRKGVSLPSLYEQIAHLVESDGLHELRSGNANKAQSEAETWAESYIAYRKGVSSFELAPVEAKYGASCPPGLMTASEFVIRNGEIWKFVKKCGACGTDINTFISKGYRCKECWNVYLGC
jgi:hypothetical protein